MLSGQGRGGIRKEKARNKVESMGKGKKDKKPAMPRGEDHVNPNQGFIHDPFFPKNYDDEKLVKIRA